MKLLTSIIGSLMFIVPVYYLVKAWDQQRRKDVKEEVFEFDEKDLY